MQEILRRHPYRRTWTLFTSWKSYIQSDGLASQVFDNHTSVLNSFGIQTNDEELDLPYIYWIPKMHKNFLQKLIYCGFFEVFDQACICSTHTIAYTYWARTSEVLQNGIVKNWDQSDVDPKEFKKLLEHLKYPKFNLDTSIKSFDFFTLYTTISHQKLKSRLATIMQNSFIHKNGNRRHNS